MTPDEEKIQRTKILLMLIGMLGVSLFAAMIICRLDKIVELLGKCYN